MTTLTAMIEAKNPHRDAQKDKLVILLVPASFGKGLIGVYKQLFMNSTLNGCKLVPVSFDEKAEKVRELARVLKLIKLSNPCLVIAASNSFLQFAARGRPLSDIYEKSYWYSSFTCCGSVYWLDPDKNCSVKLEDITVEHESTGLVPCLNLYADPTLVFKMDHARWFLGRVLDKCTIYTLAPKPIDGLKKYPKFKFIVCSDAMSLAEFKLTAETCELISLDIETSATFVSCIGYACLVKDPNSAIGYDIITFVVPFFTPTATSFTTPWKSREDEELAWRTIREVHANDVVKCMQNGASYDACYFIRYGCPLRNFTLDTLFLINALWVELPKKIDFQASLFLSHSAYWKQELKSEQDAKQESKATALPRTMGAYNTYLKYNAKDCYFTLLVLLELLNEYAKPEHAYATKAYAIKLNLQLGPLLEINLRGFPMRRDFHEQLVNVWETEELAHGMKFKYLTGNMPININASAQVNEFVYDILELPELPRIGRSSDKTHLRIIQEVSPLAEALLTPLLGQKTSANNLAKYRNLFRVHPYGLFTFSLNSAGTVTDRYASSSSNFHTGTNVQNTPYDLRLAMQAPKGCFLVKFDYSQSDMYFTAFRLEDEKMMANVLSPKDTHCLHCAEFFGESYSVLEEATKANEPWVTDNQIGIRSITKRVVYGANYGMYGFTLFMTMGFRALQATAQKLKRPHETFEDIIACANFLLDFYRTEIYGDQAEKLEYEYTQAVKNNGYIENMQGSVRKFFGDLTKPSRQRKIASYYGQNGTARNMNKAILTVYNNTKLRSMGVSCLVQVHDELVYAIPYESLHEGIAEIQRIMLEPIEYKAHTFSVPTEPDIGLGYGKRLMAYTAELGAMPPSDIVTLCESKDAKLLAALNLRQRTAMIKFFSYAEKHLTAGQF